MPDLLVPDDAHRRPRRLTSFTQMGKVFNRRRGTATDPPSYESFVNNSRAPTIARSRVSSPHSIKAGLPRSSTCSNIPRIQSSQRLPSSVTSGSRAPSRIPTPNGIKFGEAGPMHYGASKPLPKVPTSSKLHEIRFTPKHKWRRSLAPDMIMPQINRDGSTSNVSVTPKAPRSRSRTRPLSFFGSAKAQQSLPEQVGWPLSERTNGNVEKQVLEQADRYDLLDMAATSPSKSPSENEPLLANGNDQRKKSVEIVHRSLLTALEPITPRQTSLRASPLLSSSNARRNYRVLSSDTLPGSNAPSSLTARVKSAFKSKVCPPTLKLNPTFFLRTHLKAILQTISPTRSPRSLSTATDEEVPLDPGVYEPQPSEYWSGRFTSLNDAILNNNDGEVPLPSLEHDNKILIQQKELDRTRKVFEGLEGCCKTAAAKKSLSVCIVALLSMMTCSNDLVQSFKTRLAEKRGMPELLLNGPLDARARALLRGSLDSGADGDDTTPILKPKPRIIVPRKPQKHGSDSLASPKVASSVLLSEASETSLGTTRSGFIGRLMSMGRKSSWGS